MLTVKIMHDDNKADRDPSKGFRIVPVPDGGTVVCTRDNSGPIVQIVDDCGMVMNWPAPASVYVMNADGKTIATYSAGLSSN